MVALGNGCYKSTADIIFSIPSIQICFLHKYCAISPLSTPLYHGHYNSERKKKICYCQVFSLPEEFKLKVYSTEVLLCMQESSIVSYDPAKQAAL